MWVYHKNTNKACDWQFEFDGYVEWEGSNPNRFEEEAIFPASDRTGPELASRLNHLEAQNG